MHFASQIARGMGISLARHWSNRPPPGDGMGDRSIKLAEWTRWISQFFQELLSACGGHCQPRGQLECGGRSDPVGRLPLLEQVKEQSRERLHALVLQVVVYGRTCGVGLVGYEGGFVLKACLDDLFRETVLEVVPPPGTVVGGFYSGQFPVPEHEGVPTRIGIDSGNRGRISLISRLIHDMARSRRGRLIPHKDVLSRPRRKRSSVPASPFRTVL